MVKKSSNLRLCPPIIVLFLKQYNCGTKVPFLGSWMRDFILSHMAIPGPCVDSLVSTRKVHGLNRWTTYMSKLKIMHLKHKKCLIYLKIHPPTSRSLENLHPKRCCIHISPMHGQQNLRFSVLFSTQ